METGGKVRLITIDERNAGQRLDNFLISLLKGVPKSWIYRVLRRGEVRVNKGRCRPDRRLQQGDLVRVPPLRLAQQKAHRPPDHLIRDIEAAVLLEDEHLLILAKPSGLAVHGGSGVSFGVIEILRAARGDGVFLELAHRLDRETSGCLMIAKRRSSLRALQEQQQAGAIGKTYQSLLYGRTRRDSWRVTLPLRKNTLRSGERFVRVAADGKPAATVFRVRRRFPRCVQVDAELVTGRTHQIRVHAAETVGPIIGDPKYASEESRRYTEELGLQRLFLHAERLRLRHPATGKSLVVNAELPAVLRGALATSNHG